MANGRLDVFQPPNGTQTNMHCDKWFVLGAGGMGCLWAASLSHAGIIPRLIVRANGTDQQRVALKLTSGGQTQQFAVDVVCARTINEPIGQLIVCTKAQDTLAALHSIKPYLNDNCHILLLQNGMGSQQQVTQAFARQVVWAASSTDGAYLSAPFEVCHAGQGETWIGPLAGASNDGFNELFDNFRLTVRRHPTIEQKLWEKLAINCCINGLTALFDCRNGELLDGGTRQAWLDALVVETDLVLQAVGMPALALRDRVYSVCRTTADNISSTCQDARLSRVTELPFINGFLIDKAKTLGVSVPQHHALMAQLKDRDIR